MPKQRLKKHIKILGWMYVALGMFGAIFAFWLMRVIGSDMTLLGYPTLIGLFFGLTILVFLLIEILSGIILLNLSGWGRIPLFVATTLNLVLVPVGTALGIYTLGTDTG